LIKFNSGERGIFNVSTLEKMIPARRSLKPEEAGCNPCGEIILRDCEFCNLTEVVVLPCDNEKTLLDKVECATILGTVQSALTDFEPGALREK
jgi:ribonucleoside-diphosphate reductase alpha chain